MVVGQETLRKYAKAAARKIGKRVQLVEKVLEDTLRRLLQECHLQEVKSEKPTTNTSRAVVPDYEHETPPVRCYVRLPFSGNSPKYDAVRRAIAASASELLVSQYMATQIMSVFLTDIADSLCRGEPVLLPSFGLLTPTLFERPGRPPKPYIGFAANRTLALQAKYGCSTERAREGKVRLTKHRKMHNPSNRRERIHSRVFTAHAAFRKQIKRQAEGLTGKRGA